ncbi:hypothetical protein GGR57DRAFT_58813 [Xylariaceae sp. FL1272]|nr:hypothetical protein GGR57DRAFT_58813 [Xylariaceae sp. FL1272]
MMVCSRIMGSSRFFAPPKIGSQSVSSKKGDPVEPLEGSDYRPVKSKMLTMRNFVLAVFLCTSVGVGVSNATFLQADNGVAMDLSRNRVDQDLSTFSRLLNAASPKALRHFLHELVPATTKPGVVYSERSAMEALCVDSPELASSIVHLAIRQDPASQPQSSTSGQSTLSSISVPPTSTSSSSPLASPSSSSAMIPSPSSTSTMSTLSTIPTTSSSTLVSPAISTSATSTFTSTLPGGAVTTITEVAIVTPEATDGPTSTSSGMGNLQTGSPATRAERPAVELLFGVFIGGALLI